ncbi:MAG: hypothetical protein HRT57_14360, partial [Crocinitomicaceae bacterium]|nr:hypothetical protein [Crocinitomicaceae bacterium]
PFAQHELTSQFYTSDYDLSAFHAHKAGISFKYSPVYGIFNSKKRFKPDGRIKFSKAILRLSKYYRMDNTEITLKAFIATLSIKYTFVHKKPNQ